MEKRLDPTRSFTKAMESPSTAPEIIKTVYQALREKGHDPVAQIVGYLVSGDPTYITSHKNARSLIRRLERDELMEEFVRYYVMAKKL